MEEETKVEEVPVEEPKTEEVLTAPQTKSPEEIKKELAEGCAAEIKPILEKWGCEVSFTTNIFIRAK